MAKLLQASKQQLFRKTEVFIVRSTVTAASQHAFETAKPFEQIPGFRILPMCGTSWVFWPLIGKFKLLRSADYDVAKYKMFGPINRDVFGSFNMVTIYEPADVEKLFRNEAPYPSRSDFSTLRIYRELRKEKFPCKGLLVLQGKEWLDLRSRIQKNLMKIKLIEKYVAPMGEVANDLVQLIARNKDHKNEVPELLKQLSKWSLESTSYLAMNTRLGCLNVKPSEEGMQMLKNMQLTFFLINHLEAVTGNVQIWKWISTPTWRKFVSTMDYFSSIAFKYTDQTLEKIKRKTASANEDELTMMESMLATEGLDINAAVNMVVDMLIAGVDATGHTLGFLLYMFAKNPEKQEKLHQDILKLLPDPTDRVNVEVLRQLKFLKYCMKESQRLYPNTRLLLRLVEEDIVLSGFKVPAGTTVMCAQVVSHLQEKHFTNAEKFIPERWEGDSKPPPFAALPFGFGTRSCVGRRIAELEIQCAAIEVIRRFKIEYHYEDIGIETKLINIPDRPLKLTFIDRKA